MKFDMPKGVRSICETLRGAVYQAYLVGGSVRDLVLCEEPHDYDIATSATPDEVATLFPRVIDVGKKYGTVAAMLGDEKYEITTFRRDGNYSDGRRPDSVEFTCDLREDLSRRDFTMNAIAYDVRREEFYDPYNGMEDLRCGIIRCVGDPDDRFKEDALRMLRAMRFAAQLGFTIEDDTQNSIFYNCNLLLNVSRERIAAEFCKILMSADAGVRVMDRHIFIAYMLRNPIYKMAACKQNNPYHCADVWRHTLRALRSAAEFGADLETRLALFLHDTGKPESKTTDDDGIDHFYGHALASARIAEEFLTGLKFSNQIKHDVVELVRHHDVRLEVNKRCIKHLLNKFGEQQTIRLLWLRYHDVFAQNKSHPEWCGRISKVLQCIDLAKEIIAEKECFCLKDLAVNGKILMSCFDMREGKDIGRLLNKLLDAVIEGRVKNDGEELIRYATQFVAYGGIDVHPLPQTEELEDGTIIHRSSQAKIYALSDGYFKEDV